jgi:hypothetical protein
LYTSTNIVRVNKLRRMRLVRHVARIVDIRNTYKILVGKLKGKDHSDDLDVNGKRVLKCILEKEGGNMRTGCI